MSDKATTCPHASTVKVITKEATHESCDDCGASRVTFVVEPFLKEGAQLTFRTRDWSFKPTSIPIKW